jgi:hypothetical protein
MQSCASRYCVQPPCTARIVVTFSVRFDCDDMLLPLVLPVVLRGVFPAAAPDWPVVPAAPLADAPPLPVAGARDPTISTH